MKADLVDPEACEAAGKALALAVGNDVPIVIALAGDLGAGKTCFARGFVRGIAPLDDVPVASPTWAVCHTYDTTPTVHHLDLYRLESDDDLESIGFWELLPDAILLVEWPDRVASVAELADVRAEFTVTGPSTRTMLLTAVSDRGRRVLDQLDGASST